MEKEFIGYSEALALKELGFDTPCFGFYNSTGVLINDYRITKDKLVHCNSSTNCVSPTFSQAFRWFREIHRLEASIQRMPPEVYGKGKGDIKNYLLYIWAENLNPRGQQTLHFDAYEEAELACLKKLIKIVKEKFAQVKN